MTAESVLIVVSGKSFDWGQSALRLLQSSNIKCELETLHEIETNLFGLWDRIHRLESTAVCLLVLSPSDVLSEVRRPDSTPPRDGISYAMIGASAILRDRFSVLSPKLRATAWQDLTGIRILYYAVRKEAMTQDAITQLISPSLAWVIKSMASLRTLSSTSIDQEGREPYQETSATKQALKIMENNTQKLEEICKEVRDLLILPPIDKRRLSSAVRLLLAMGDAVGNGCEPILRMASQSIEFGRDTEIERVELQSKLQELQSLRDCLSSLNHYFHIGELL